MAVYTNDLRLKEIATGDESGTWGTSTNTNLSLIADAFSFGTEAITTNADTHTTTIADGAADPGRSIFLKYTGTLDSACTITIGPNTVSKLWFIENATSGSQNIIIKQGSGATVTIANGQTKAIYSDGAGSGGAMVDAFQDLSIPDLFIDDDLTFTSDSAVITFGADGDTTLTHTDGSGLTLNSTNKLMFNDASQFIQGSSATVLSLGATDEIDLTATAIDINGTVDISSTLDVGAKVTIDPADGVEDEDFALFVRNNEATAGRNFGVMIRAGSNASDESITVRNLDNSSEFFTVHGDGSTTVNESGVAAADFRVESDSNANMLFVDSGNNLVGIGTNSPTTALTVSTDGTQQLTINRADSSISTNNTVGTILFTGDDPSANQIGARIQVLAAANWATNAFNSHITFSNDSSGTITERARISGDGQFLVGTTASRTLSGVVPNLFQEGTGYNSSALGLVTNANDAATAPFLMFGKSRGTSDGSSTVVQSGDRLGGIFFTGADGTDIESLAAVIQASVDGTPGGNDMPGRLQFFTTPDGSEVTQERMRIHTAGEVSVGTTSANGSLAVAGVLALEPGGPVSIDASNGRPNLARNADGELRIAAGKDSNGFITFHVTPSGSTNVMERFKIAENITYTGRAGTSPIFSLVNSDTEDTATGRESTIRFSGFRSGGESCDNGQISGNHNGSADNDDGMVMIWANRNADGLRERARLTNEDVVFNEGSDDVDFRIESDSKAHMLFVNAGSNFVGVGNSVGRQTIANLNCRENGASIEFGHQNNTSGFFGTLGSFGSNGHPYIGFSCSSEASANTFSTFGHAGNIIHGDTNGNLLFQQVTTASATGQTPLERARILSTGDIVFGNTGSTVSNAIKTFIQPTTTECGRFSAVGGNNTNGGFFVGARLDTTAATVVIRPDGDIENINNTYAALSDQRLKQDIVDASSQWDDIKALKVRKYRFKSDPEKPLQIGVVAQELEGVSPGLVETTEDDITYGDGIEGGVKTVKYSVLYMKAIKALQEAMTRIETLETKVAALEGGS